jgi:hypothetical protein
MLLQDAKHKIRGVVAVVAIVAVVVAVANYTPAAGSVTAMFGSAASLARPDFEMLGAAPQRAGSPNVNRAAMTGLEMTGEGCLMSVDTDSGVGPYKVIPNVPHAAACCSDCSKDSKCVSWAFHEAQNSCHLKRAQGKKIRATGVVYGLPSASGAKCSMDMDYDSSAEPYKVVSGEDAGKCCSQCTTDKRCVQWSFNKQQKKCRLKDHEGQKLKKDHTVLGRAEVTLPGCTIKADTDTADKPFLSIPNVEYKDTCCAKCSDTKGCEVWSFDVIHQTCHLKSGMGKQFHSHGIITGQPQVSAMGCMLRYGKDTDSKPFKILTKMTRLDDCCAQCAQDERCLVWSFNSQESRCYLKAEHGSVVEDANVTMGVPEMSTSGCIVSVDSDSDAPVYRTLSVVSTADQCCYQCGADDTCDAWSFDSARHTCFLKRGKGNKLQRSGFLLGYPGLRKPAKRLPITGGVDFLRSTGHQRPTRRAGSITYSNYRRAAGNDVNVITVGDGARVHVSGGQLYVGPQADVNVGGQATVNVAGRSEMHVTGRAQVAADGQAKVFLHHDNVDMQGRSKLSIQGEAPVSVDGPGARVSVGGSANVEARGGSNVHVHHDSNYINAGSFSRGAYEGYGEEEGAPEYYQ